MVNTGMVQALRTSDNLFDGSYTVTSVTVTIASALALYNALELVLLIATTFRRFDTLWPAMVTGQSLVLYSRLGVVLGPGYEKLLRTLKWVIIVDAVVNHGGTIILTFGSYYLSPTPEWIEAYNIQHKIQRTCFTIQECVLSGLYIWRALHILRTSAAVRGRRQTILLMWQLIAINLVILGLDIFVLVEEFAALVSPIWRHPASDTADVLLLQQHAVKQAVKAMTYAIKLKLEFAVLGRLVEVTNGGSANTGPIMMEVKRGGLAEQKDPASGQRTSWSRHSLMAMGHGKANNDIEKCIPNPHTESVATLVKNDGLNPEIVVQAPHDCSHLAVTNDEQRRRRSREEDLYSGMCRDLAG
ncbi:hypothetical protein LTR56_008781 [Elasticomyces elasticus]|nr:hypothetical protein LTR22_017566 [Elasticomyces elasticus]KAK3646163.1 hypothetical protein LTR56_008781 [Elasticomyces elasticus]KAK4924344.1 hypothetical protein LTR49_008645 [Elasticomyces elasticus]KAK5759097.1 hypothetical protein LTS12_010705 [Elasticomyces elasticus]